MSEEFKKLLVLALILFIILLLVVLRVKVFSISSVNKIFHKLECVSVPYKDGKTLCLGKDAGFKSDYQTAAAYCNKLNLKLPSREEARYIWASSENCRRAAASGFSTDKNTACNINSSIKFARALQYTDGSFWLRDSAGGKLHYAVNYYDNTVDVYKDSSNSLGVRCVSLK